MQYSADTDYNYAFNGKENESGGLDGNLDFGARVYNSDIGSWLKRDKYENLYRNLSPYSISNANPINFLDPDGNNIYYFNDSYKNLLQGFLSISPTKSKKVLECTVF